MANDIIRNGRLQETTTIVQRARSDRSKRAPDIAAIESRNWLLHRHYTRHEYNACKLLIEQELSKSDGHEYANYLKGLILRKEGKIQDSLDCFQTAYNVNSTNVDNVKQIAKSLLIMGSHQRAIDAYIEAEKISVLPDWEIYNGLGEAHVKLNQLQEAKKYLKRSAELTKNELPNLALAKLYLLDDMIPEARTAYTAALNGNSESIDAATELGLLYLRIGDTQRAFQQFGAALAHSSNCVNAILPMAYIMQNHREYDVALSKYKVAAQTIPESSVLWNNIGMCLYGKQKYVAAISSLKRAHYLCPLSCIPSCNLGIVFLTTGQPASAAVYLCAAVSAEPKNPTPYLLLGLALKRLDDLEGAERSLTKAHALAPQDPLILINYAVVLDARGKQANATEILIALNDIMAVVDVDTQVSQMAKKLSKKLHHEETKANQEPSTDNSEERQLSADEV
ncbi:PREDICTED: Bardet-Biedl syndrome 4 protein isoform X2 [Dinoponera quadriceps]|uniref:Bardet-Biedl syndrome 4 protein isoform X2 n=1 Tax=Dinoponera quadriceps TaxID=609295 RepID=A0A6P3YG60_DINQU|nr:PREDICTED: Bardet-Biedl syndrome 4 protein isoform X2 [Dinoponera quadriceps]XP_014489485.1 PREDICTED: Bardet-Biedl syndrome 4 protein isoform X2 [Dinoponera quadriceps]